MATESKRIRRDTFIKSVRPDPKSTDELVLLQGYIGDSDLPGHLRVYSDPALSDFIDLPEQEICYSEPVKPEEDPLGGSRLWVKKTIVFTAGDPKLANRVKSTFLEGDIVQAFGNQGTVRPPKVVAQEIHSAFVEGGCGVVTERFEGCGISIANCTVAEPTNTILPTRCGKQTCVQPSCQVGCTLSGNPFAICISVNNRTCEVFAQAAANLRPCFGGTFGCIGGTIGCFRGTIGCGFLTRTCFGQTLCLGGTRTCVGGTIGCFRGTIQCIGGTIQCGGGTIQCGGGTLYTPVQTDVVVNPAVQQQQYAAQTYTGGFDPYQTANYGY